MRAAREDDGPSIYPFFRATVEAGRTSAYPPNLSSQTDPRAGSDAVDFAPTHLAV